MVELVDFDSIDISRDSELWLLDVEASQKAYVASINIILGRAYVFRNQHPRVFWIFTEDIAVGMALYYDDPEHQAYDLSQIFIDKRYQGHGYGKAAVGLILEEMRKDGRYQKTTLCYVEGNDVSRELFKSFGFTETSHDWDEIIMEADL